MSNVPAIDVEQLRDMIQEQDPPLILDVREVWENELCSLPNSKLIPLALLPTRVAELAKEQVIVVHCHHGGRSARAVAFLLQQGFTRVFNLRGGVHAWSLKIDSNMKTYE